MGVMSIKEMDSIKHVIPWRNGQKQFLKFNGCKPKIYTNSYDNHSFFEVLQCLQKEEVLCDIRLKTDDGTLICGHKVVLVSACPYFHAMFTSFAEGAKYVDLLPTSMLLQLDDVKGVCVEFLKKKQMNLSNCPGIKEFADFYNCMKLLSSSEEYIKTHFLKFIETDEFLSLSSEEVINLISCNDINVPFEEKVWLLKLIILFNYII